MSERWRDRATLLAAAVLAVLMLGPALGPGYALIGDQVFVPDQDLLPWMVGLGGGLPRSVPQDAVVAVLTGPVPGWVWQTVALVTAIVALGSGVGRLVRPAGRRASLAAAVIACWSPYVGERLLLGHWSLLLAVSMLPWALHHARSAHAGVAGSLARWLLVLAVASLTVTGGLLVLLVSAPVLLWRGPTDARRRACVVLAGALLQLPWLVPALLHPQSTSPGGADVFALRSEGPLGAFVTALGTGGVWNVGAVPDSRTTWLAPLLTVVLLVLAYVGLRQAVSVLGRPVAISLAAAAIVGIVVAVGGAVAPDAMAGVVAHLPGGGLLRDGQKWLAPWLVLLAACAGCGAARVAAAIARATHDPVVGGAVLVVALALPLACVPDLVWGSMGRLATVSYPDDWARARAALAADPGPGDVISLPWQAFRAFDWNRGRTVLDPAPRFMPRTVVTSQDLLIVHDGSVVVVAGDDPRAERIGAALDTNRDVDGTLRREGVGWALVSAAPGAPVPFTGATAVVAGPDLTLYRLRPPDRPPAVSGLVVVVVANMLALAVVILSAFAVLRSQRRRARGDTGAVPTDW